MFGIFGGCKISVVEGLGALVVAVWGVRHSGVGGVFRWVWGFKGVGVMYLGVGLV